jgi:hypothetical protein
MTWSLNAKGDKGQCAAALEASTPPGDPGDVAQYNQARSMIDAELARYDEGSSELSIAASGHAPDHAGGDRSFSVWISGKAVAKPAPHVEGAKAKADATADKPAERRR